MAMPLKTRLLIFLYSTGNLLGCCLALISLSLFFGNIIRDWWLGITIGMYIAGVLLVPGQKGIAAQLPTETPDLLTSLDRLIAASRKRLPAEAQTRLANIRSLLTELTPKMTTDSMAMTQNIAITNAITRDLPATLNNYLKLPSAFANLHPVDGQKTCKVLLLEQLELLDTQLSKLAENVFKQDAEALLLNGQFLKEKFHSLVFVEGG